MIKSNLEQRKNDHWHKIMLKLPNPTYEHLRATLVVLFISYIMLVYPFLNTINENNELNRAILITLIFFVLFSNLKRTVSAMILHRDNTSVLITIYLLFTLFSLMVYFVSANMPLEGMLPFFLNSILPIIFYFTFFGYPRRNEVIITVLIAMFINILVGLLCYPFFNLQNLAHYFIADPHIAAMHGSSPSRLSSLVGSSSIMGFLCQLGFAYVLFYHRGKYKSFLLATFLLSAILSFQRGAWMAVLMAITLYLVDGRTSMRSKILLSVMSGALVVGTILSITYSTENDTLGRLLRDRVEEFSYRDAMDGRAFQQVIFNTENAFCILFGEGYGKYSPLNILDNFQQPDAPYYMIYNETGILGSVLFLSIFLSLALKSLRYRNFFMLYFVGCVLIYLLGTRIMWYFPTNYIIFMTVAIFSNDRFVESTANRHSRASTGLAARWLVRRITFSKNRMSV